MQGIHLILTMGVGDPFFKEYYFYSEPSQDLSRSTCGVLVRIYGSALNY
jgi:hypothetical protein